MGKSAAFRGPPDGREARQQFVFLLNEALQMSDALSAPPEIGARLQEVVNLAESWSRSTDEA
jgi:hypothetical protein